MQFANDLGLFIDEIFNDSFLAKDSEDEIFCLCFPNATSVTIKDCNNLKLLILELTEDCEVIIENCPTLERIITKSIVDTERFKKLHIGVGVNNLTNLISSNCKSLYITDGIYEKLEYIQLTNINEIIADFSQFRKLFSFLVKNVNLELLCINSNNIEYLDIIDSYCNNITLKTKKKDLYLFRMQNIEVNIIDFRGAFDILKKIRIGSISYKFPSIEFSDDIINKVNFYLDTTKTYPKKFSKVMKNKNLRFYDNGKLINTKLIKYKKI